MRGIDRRQLLAVLCVLVLLVVPVSSSNITIGSIHNTTEDFESGVLDGLSANNDEIQLLLFESVGDKTVTSRTDQAGYLLRIDEETQVSIELEDDVQGATDAYIYTSTGGGTPSPDELVEQKSIDGDKIDFDTVLAPDDYFVVIDSGGNSYQSVDVNLDDNLPQSTGPIEVYRGYDGGVSSGYGYNIKRVSPDPISDSPSYQSQPHEIDDPADGTVNITELQNTNGTIRWQAYDGAWETVDTQNISTSGEYSTALPSGFSTWRVIVEIDLQQGSEVTISEDYVRFENNNPAMSNPNPSGGETVSETPVELNIDVEDEQFGTAQGENVTVEFRNASDDSVIGTDTLSSNGTATASWSDTSGGTNQWYVVATDEYGGETVSDTFSFSFPDTLYIRNESDPDTLVQEATVEITFYGDDTVIERSTTNGEIDLTGLDPEQRFVVVAEANGYVTRRAVIDSIIEQQDVYLLNSTVSTVDVRFTNEDDTGTFPDDSEVIVQRPITRNNTTEYQTVASDEFGINGYTTTLENDVRYRIKIRSPDGDVRVLGSYTTSQTETVPLQPIPSGIELNTSDSYNWVGYFDNVSGQNRLVFEFEDGAEETTNIEIAMYEQGNKSNAFPNETISGPVGSVIVSEPLTDNQSRLTWVIEWTADRNGETISGKVVVGPEIRHQVPDLDPWVKEAAAVTTVILIAALFSQLNVGVGAVTTSMVGGGFWFIGWLPRGAGGVIGLALFIAVIYKAAFRGGR